MWWGLFAVGGTIAALLLPVHIFLNNIAAPLGWVTLETSVYGPAAALARTPLVKAYLVVLLAFTFFHAAHRLTFLPQELLLPMPRSVAAFVFYGAAAFLSLMPSLWLSSLRSTSLASIAAASKGKLGVSNAMR